MVDYVEPHNPKWKTAFRDEVLAIRAALAGTDIHLHHIGSTSIEGILAKPIIDLLGVVADLDAVDEKTEMFTRIGYEAMGAYGIENRRYFRKTTRAGVRSHHLHIYAAGSPHIERHLAFRDYLIAHPDKAADYSDLKARLTSADNVTWDTYLDGKAPFILKTEQDALRWYRSARSGARSADTP